MSGWDTLNKNAGAKTSTASSSGWDSLNAAAQPTKLQRYQAEAETSMDEAKRANSIGTLTKETVKGVLSKVTNAAKAGWQQGVQGASDMLGPNRTLTQRGEGLLNWGAGALNTVASPLAPITEPIGKAVEYGGNQLAKTPLIKQWGEANPQNGQLTPLERGLGAVVNATTIVGASAPLLGTRIPGLKAPVKPSPYTQTGEVPLTPPLQIPRNTEYQNVPVFKPLAVRSTTPESTRVNVQTPYLTPDQMPTIQMGNKADRPTSNLPVIDYNSSRVKPVLPKPKSKNEIMNPVEEMKMRVEFAKESLDQNPAKDLMKYVSRSTGALPEVNGQVKISSVSGSGRQVKNSKFGQEGDDIIKSAGFDDANQAQGAIEKYQADKVRIDDMKQMVREATQKAREEIKAQPKPVPEKPLRYIPVEEPKRAPVLAKPKPAIKTTPIKARVVPVETKIASPIQKTGRVTKVARRINDDLVKLGYDELPPEAQSKYTPTSYKETAQNVANEMADDITTSIKMAKGEVPLSKKLHGHGQILLNAVEKYAVDNGDAALLQDLAKSPIGKERSLAAQKLGESGYNSNPYSPVAAIDDVNKARASKGPNPDKVVKEIKEAISKQKPDWNNFIDSLKC